MGLVAEEDIDKSLRRLLRARFLLGMFDPPEIVPFAQIPFDMVDCQAHRELALEAARKSIVLLKNEKKFLPLSKNIKTIAVIGPNADHINVLLGNYNGQPSKAVTPLEGIKNKVSSRTKILYSRGCNISNSIVFESIPSEYLSPDVDGKQKGLKGEYFNNMNLEDEPVVTRIDETVDFDWGFEPPAPGVNNDHFSIRWTGFLTPQKSGEYKIGVTNDDGMKLFIDDEPIVTDWSDHATSTSHKILNLEAYRSYEIKIEYYENELHAVAKLVWIPPYFDPFKDAVEKALESDVIIAVMGISGEIEGETYDKEDLNLPSVQDELLDLLYRTGKPVALVLLNGSPVAINREDERFPAILTAWYPGEEGGTAIADVIFGDYNPGGRLPVTFYKSLDQVPDFENYNMEGRTYRYLKEEPLYSFGYGLSYTRFHYSSLNIEPKKPENGENIKVSVCVKNKGKIPGDEVVQLYISDLKASAPVPIRQLAGFQRIYLKPKEEKVVTFHVNRKHLAFWDDAGKWLVEPGDFEISVGGCLPSKKYKKRSGAKVLTKRIKMTGNKLYFDD